MEDEFSKGVFIGIWIGICLQLLFRLSFPIPLVPEKQKSVSEYIQHPENFKIEYVIYKGDTTNIIVTYLK